MNSRSLATPQDSTGDGGANPDRKPRRRSIKAVATGEGNAIEKPAGPPPATVAAFDNRSKPASSPVEHIKYNGHILKVEPQRGGWKVTVFPEGSPFALHRIAYTSESSGRDLVVAQAKAVVDAESPKPPAQSPAPAPEQAEAVDVQSEKIEKTVAELAQQLLQWSSKAVSAAKRVYFSIDKR
jgi:hypothetical protein